MSPKDSLVIRWNHWIRRILEFLHCTFQQKKTISMQAVFDIITFLGTDGCSLRPINAILRVLQISIFMHATWPVMHGPNKVSPTTCQSLALADATWVLPDRILNLYSSTKIVYWGPTVQAFWCWNHEKKWKRNSEYTQNIWWWIRRTIRLHI